MPRLTRAEPGRYRYRRLGIDEQTIALDASGNACLRPWRREERSLVLTGDHADTCRHGWENDASWLGRERWYQQVAVELRSLD